MIQKDYIMRIIEQLGKILAKVLLNKNAGENKEALSNIESALKNMLGLDSELLNALSADSIAEFFGISKDKSTASVKCIVVGRLLKEMADIQNIRGTGDSSVLSYYHKALRLYLQGMLNIGYTELDIASYCADTLQIADQLGNSLPDDLMFQLFCFYRHFEMHKRAEDCLFRLKLSGFPGIIEIGTAFFTELLKVDDVKLRNCNLTREEVQTSLEKFISTDNI